jgi:hypothetical protein
MQRVPLLGVQACPHRRHRRVTVERIWILDLKFGSMNLDFADASDFAGAEKVKSLHDFSVAIFFPIYKLQIIFKTITDCPH